jgi:hypothetical protein
MKIFGLVSLVIAASASFAAADKLAKFEGDLTAIALPLSQRTPQLAGQINSPFQKLNVRAPFPQSYSCCAHCSAQNAFAIMLEMSGGFDDVVAEIEDNAIIDQVSKMARAMGGVRTILEAMNMAFASSVAEITVSEDGGASLDVRSTSMHAPIIRSRRAALSVSLQQKTNAIVNAIANAIANAFLQTTGRVNYDARSSAFLTSSLNAHLRLVHR